MSVDRNQLGRLVNILIKGDVVVVTRLDRLARSTRDLLHPIDVGDFSPSEEFQSPTARATAFWPKPNVSV